MNEQRKKVRHLLYTLGVCGNVKGFSYLEEAVLMVLEDRESIHGITTILYPKIASKFNVTKALVERSMRRVIETIWERTDGIDRLNNIFGFVFSKRPTNAQMVALLSDKINEE